MTNNDPIIIPADFDAATAMRDTLIAASTYMTASATRIADPILDPFTLISDSDDYMPAAASIAATIIANAFDSTHDDPRAALTSMLADPDFITDLMTADFDCPLHDLIPDFD